MDFDGGWNTPKQLAIGCVPAATLLSRPGDHHGLVAVVWQVADGAHGAMDAGAADGREIPRE